ncbi:MAG TPA: ATP-binding protein [Thermoanaerobaculia bacterium]
MLLVSLAAAAAVAWGLGAALQHAGVERIAAATLAAAAFAIFLVPWSGVALWALRRARDLDELTDRTRAAAEGAHDEAIATRHFHGELDDLARAAERMRATIVRQRDAHEEHRAAMAEIVGSLGEGLLAIDPKGRVAVANERALQMFGAGSDAIGRSALAVVSARPGGAAIMTALDAALRGDASTTRVTPDDGRQIEVRAFPVAASREIAAVALFIDVTALERLERIRKDFLDDFSHEVRTPLAGLRSAVETFERGELGAEAEQQLRQVMQRQILRIERLVKDLSDLNQIESGRLVLERQTLSLREVLAELCDDGRGVALHGDAVACIDPARAQQIFSNLLDNAARHGGGEITVDVEPEESEAVVRVSDRGPGIPEGELDRVFHRFHRIDRSRSQPGTGLGLAIAKHLAALHGGSIRAYNRAGGGATFEVRLPRE